MTTSLTADICAHGIIASARYLGFDPVKAMLAKRGPTRAAVTAAALAAKNLTNARHDAVARIFGVQATSIARCERESSKGFDRASAAASQAMVAAGLDLSQMLLGGAPPPRAAAPSTGAVAAQPSVQAIDHTPAIREALRRRGARPVEVVGVEADKALLPPVEAGGCHWPLGDLALGTLRSCGAQRVEGRMYCPDHCRSAGQKATPKPIKVVGRVAAPYRDPRADNAIGRKAAS